MILNLPELSICKRCQNYVLTTLVEGFDISVDPQILVGNKVIEAIVAKRTTYDLITGRSGKALGLVRRNQFSKSGKPIVGQHICNGMPMDSVEVVPIPKEVPASFGAYSAGFAQTSPGSASHAGSAIRHPSKCDDCHIPITDYENAIGIQQGYWSLNGVIYENWIWLVHIDCAKELGWQG